MSEPQIFDEKLIALSVAAETTRRELSPLSREYEKLDFAPPAAPQKDLPCFYSPINPVLLTGPPPAYLLVTERECFWSSANCVVEGRRGVSAEKFSEDRGLIVPRKLVRQRQKNHDSWTACKYYDWRIQKYLSESSVQIYVPPVAVVAAVEEYDWKVIAGELHQLPLERAFPGSEAWARKLFRFKAGYYDITKQRLSLARQAGYDLPELPESTEHLTEIPDFLDQLETTLEIIMTKIKAYEATARDNFIGDLQGKQQPAARARELVAVR